MMKKKMLSLLCCVLLCISMLSGCANKNADTSEQTQGAEEETPVDKTGEVSLLVWCGSEEEQTLLGEMVESFKKQYEGERTFNITVEIESESSCKDTLLGDVLNGADVFAFPDDQLMALIASGALEPIEDTKIKEANSESSVEAASYDGKLYAYPMTADNGYFMYYNKAYFTEEDVKELDRMLEAAAKVDKQVMMDWSSGWYLYSFFGGSGLEFGLNDDGITNYCTWNSTEGEIKGKDIAEAMLAIAKNPGFASGGDSDFLDGARAGTVIAGVNGVWNATTLQEIWGSNYAAVKLPSYTCNNKQVQLSSFAGYKMVGVNAYSDEKEWANKFADWITNEENQTLRFERREQGPSNNKASESPEVLQSPAIQALIQQSEFAKLQRVGANYWDPIYQYGEAIVKGNIKSDKLQSLLDTLVEGITATQVK